MNKELSLFGKTVALTAMCILSFVCVYISSLLGINGKLTLWILSSAAICVTVMVCGKGAASISCMMLAVLALFFIKSYTARAFFICIFAPYPILKSIYEKHPSVIIVLIYKVCTFAVLTFLAVCFLKIYNFKAYLYLFALIAGLVYDYLLSLFIEIFGYYRLKIHGIDPFSETEENRN